MAFSIPTSQTGAAAPSTDHPLWDYPPPSSHPQQTLGRPPPHSRHYYLKSNYPNQSICLLCHKDFATNARSRIIRELPCGDIFHMTCIDDLLEGAHGLCPACNHLIDVEWYWSDDEEDELERRVSGPFLGDEIEEKRGEGNCLVRHLQRFGARMKEMCRRPLLQGRKEKKLFGGYRNLDGGRWRWVERKTGASIGGRRFGHVRG